MHPLGECGGKARVMVKVVFQDGEDVRALKCNIIREDEHFIYTTGPMGDITIGKKFIIKIEGENNERQTKQS